MADSIRFALYLYFIYSQKATQTRLFSLCAGGFLFILNDLRYICMNYDAYFWDKNYKPKRYSLSKNKNNERLKESAEINAEYMKANPSFLEKMVIEFFDSHDVQYEFQKIFYIADKYQYIKRYFIADFYIPAKKLIVEADGKYHEERKKYDEWRTQVIKEHYRKVKVLRVTYNDLKNGIKLQKLLHRVK